MILNEKEIKKLHILNIPEPEKAYREASLDLSLKEDLCMLPGEFKQVVANEYLHLPTNVVARVHNKAGVSAKGLVAPGGNLFGPNYKGLCYIPLVNLSTNVIKLQQDARFCQLTFEKVAATRSCKICGDNIKGDARYRCRKCENEMLLIRARS